MIRLDTPHGELDAYSVGPAHRNDRVGALVLIHEVVGLSDYMKDVARRLGHAGFDVLAPNLYDGLSAIDSDDPAAIRAVLAAVDDRRFIDIIASASDELRSRTAMDEKVGLIGFCAGGTYALIAAEQLSGVRAVVSFYGPITHEITDLKPYDLMADADQMEAAVLLIYGDADHAIPVLDVLDFAIRLEEAECDVVTRIYASAPHGFHSEVRPERYRDAYARDAWAVTVDFLTRNLQ